MGSTANDRIGAGLPVTALTNGNYVVQSQNWDCQSSLGCSGTAINVGAVTWGNGTTGTIGTVSATNSLVGSTANDGVGSSVIPLTNGNYVVVTHAWDCQATLGCSGTVADVGAVTWSSGTSGITGAVSVSNSLVGSTLSDWVGFPSVVALTNGNYIVASRNWDCQAALGCSGTITNVGAVTWGNGTTGITGFVSASNSLIGSTTGDNVGDSGNIALSNGNYVVSTKSWDCQASLGCSGTVADVGAVTWGNGATGLVGVVSASNSLVGTTASDEVGLGLTALSNGNYVVRSPGWDCQASLGCSGTVVDAGAVTWGNGASGMVGIVNTSNSVVGSTASDQIGGDGVIALTNGNYVVMSKNWDCQPSLGCSGAVADVGAATWGPGTSGITGVVSATNSLVGSTANDQVGSGVGALSNGNYVVVSSSWDCQTSLGCSGTVTNVGAVTWASGTTGLAGAVNTTNSLVGSSASDQVGSEGFTALSNGHYVVMSKNWDCQPSLGCSGTFTNVGAVTWGNGTTGTTGAVSASNSLVGSTASDQVGSSGVAALTNGNYVVRSQNWDCQVALGCSGTRANSGAVTWGDGTTGVTGAVSTSNSLVGSTANDAIGNMGIIALTNGNYVVSSATFDSAANTDIGLAFIANGSASMYGIIPK